MCSCCYASFSTHFAVAIPPLLLAFVGAHTFYLQNPNQGTYFLNIGTVLAANVAMSSFACLPPCLHTCSLMYGYQLLMQLFCRHILFASLNLHVEVFFIAIKMASLNSKLSSAMCVLHLHTHHLQGCCFMNFLQEIRDANRAKTPIGLPPLLLIVYEQVHKPCPIMTCSI